MLFLWNFNIRFCQEFNNAALSYHRIITRYASYFLSRQRDLLKLLPVSFEPSNKVKHCFNPFGSFGVFRLQSLFACQYRFQAYFFLGGGGRGGVYCLQALVFGQTLLVEKCMAMDPLCNIIRFLIIQIYLVWIYLSGPWGSIDSLYPRPWLRWMGGFMLFNMQNPIQNLTFGKS